MHDDMMMKCRVVWIQGKPGDCIHEPAEQCSWVQGLESGSGACYTTVIEYLND
jgi:hypothetical protein